MIGQPVTPEKRQRLVKLFEFLKAYTDLRFPAVRDISKQLKTLRLDNLPSHSSVELLQQVNSTETRIEDADVVLRLARPAITPCPTPPRVLLDWLKPGWQEVANKAEI